MVVGGVGKDARVMGRTQQAHNKMAEELQRVNSDLATALKGLQEVRSAVQTCRQDTRCVLYARLAVPLRSGLCHWCANTYVYVAHRPNVSVLLLCMHCRGLLPVRTYHE